MGTAEGAGTGVAHDGRDRGAAREPPTPLRRARRGWMAGAAAGGVVLLATLLYLYGLHADWSNADLVRGLIQGSDMAHGNVLLNHWYSGADSFWTLDLVLFALGVTILGTQIIVLHLVSALVWSLVIVVSIRIASEGLRGRAAAAAGGTVLAVLALPAMPLVAILSQSMMHGVTTLCALGAFLGLRRGRLGWGWAAAVLLFALATLGDPLIIAFGLAPAVVVGVLESARARDWRVGIPTLSAPLVALEVAAIVRAVTDHFGTFRVSSTAPVVSRAQALLNLRHLGGAGAWLLGLGRGFAASRVPWELEVVRAVTAVALVTGVVVAIACLLLNVISGTPRLDVQGMADRSDASFRLSDLLVVGVVADAGAYVALGIKQGAPHYLVTGVIFASILAAMIIGQLSSPRRSRRWWRVASVAAVTVVASYAACVGVVLARPIPVSPFVQLGRFLEGHHLHRGLGDYWTSAPVTVYSHFDVTVRQVIPSRSGGLEPYLVLAKTTWYTGRFQFLVINLHESAYGVPEFYGQEIAHAARYPFAPIAHVYRDGSFFVIVWRRPVSLTSLASGQVGAASSASRPRALDVATHHAHGRLLAGGLDESGR